MGKTAAPTGISMPASKIGERMSLSPAALALLTGPGEPAGFATQLERAGLHEDLLRFCAGWLPKRSALWWGCLGVWHVLHESATDPAKAALGGIVRWLREPTEARQRALEALATAAGTQTAPGFLALAAFYSESTAPGASPPEMLTADMVAGALLLGAASIRNARPADVFHHFRLLACDVANGKNRYT